MKNKHKNAIYLAAISLVAAGCANQGGYASHETGSVTHEEAANHWQADSSVRGANMPEVTATGRIEPPTTLEHDITYDLGNDAGDLSASSNVRLDKDSTIRSEFHDHDESYVASGTAAGAVSGSSASGTIRADSSVRGGSDRARGHDFSGNDRELSTRSMDARVQADSSLRGGSMDARGQGFRSKEMPSEPGDARGERRIKADSSIRGGSDRARGFDTFWRTERHSHEGDRRSSLELNEASGSSAAIERGFQDSEVRSTYDGTPLESNQDRPAESAVAIENNPDPSAELEAEANSTRDNSITIDTESEALSQIEPETSGSVAIESGEMPGDAESPLRDGLAEDPYHPNGLVEDEAVGGFKGVESETGNSESNVSEPRTEDSSQPDAEADISIPPNESEPRDDSDAISSEPSSTDPTYLFNTNPAKGIGAPAQNQSEVGLGELSRTESKSGADLSGRVQQELNREDSSPARNVEVTSHGSTVTLKGSVANEEQKRMMEERARQIEGVNRVDNQLTISAQSDADERE